MKGIIFDFNGTMFQDSYLHEAAWIHMVKKYSKGTLSEHDILVNLHGRTNKEILNYFISDSLTDLEIDNLGFEKESYYRELCLDHPDTLKLTDGLISVINYLKSQEVPMTIATATVKDNVEFYFKTFNLDKWFNFDKVVYDNGTFPGKPAPDIFQIASNKLDLQPKDCLVVEDAYSGILAAKKAGIGKIIAIDPFSKNRELFTKNNMAVDGIIKDFTNFFEVAGEFKNKVIC